MNKTFKTPLACAIVILAVICGCILPGKMIEQRNKTTHHAEDGPRIEKRTVKDAFDEAITHEALCESYTFDINSDRFEGSVSDDEMGDYQICFEGTIDHLGTLKIGKGDGLTAGMYLLLKESTVEVYTSIDNNMLAVYNHRLQLKGYVYVMIAPDLQGKAILRIKTDGGEYTVGQVPWTASEGPVFVASIGKNKLKDCSLIYHCEGWEKETWLFGDSYFSTTRPDRWTTYLVNDGYSDFMMNGWPGRNSEEALASLRNCLRFGTPKTIVWCLGMNDGPDEEVMNPNWREAIEELQMLCKDHNTKIIFATIPNCPAIDNHLKNDYVRSSGSEYIDFAAAVGSDSDPFWTAGMIENEEEPCHPSIEGAVALYNEAISKTQIWDR